MRAWAAAGMLVTTAAFAWGTAALAGSGWPLAIRLVGCTPIAVLWAAAITVALEAYLGRRAWSSPAGHGVIGSMAVGVAASRVLGVF